METIICNGATEKIQDTTLNSVSQIEGLLHNHSSLVKQSEVLEKFSMDDKVSGTVNGCGNSLTPPKLQNELSNRADNLVQKSSSPTLIEHAFKVVKNIFSPDKNRSKPSSVLSSVSQTSCPSGSPHSNMCILNKTEFPLSDSELENLKSTVLIETSLKGEPISYVDHLGLNSNAQGQDSHNNTNDSFLTTASLIEESFQSAVTHLEDNGDALSEGSNSTEDIFNCYKNIEGLDTINDTVCSNGLENTLLKNNSYDSMENRLLNLSDCSEEAVEADIDNEETFSQNNKVVTSEAKFNLERGVPTSGDTESSSNTDIALNVTNDAPAQKNVDVESIVNLAEKIKLADESVSKSFVKNQNASVNQTHAEDANGNPETVVSDTDLNIVDAEIVKSRICEINNKTSIVGIQGESENVADTNISTTTIILGDADNELDAMLLYLKTGDKNDNVSPVSDQTEGSPSISNNEVFLSNVKNIDESNKQGKRPCKSGDNTPHKLNSENKNKLNKSFDEITRKNVYSSPKGRTTLNQATTEELVSSLPQGNTTTDSYGGFESENHGAVRVEAFGFEAQNKTNLPSDVDEVNPSSASLLQDTIPLSSQQSYTILSTIDNDLKRPVIKSLDDSSDCIKESCSMTVAKGLEIRKTTSDLTNDSTNKPVEDGTLVLTAKQSTPELSASVCHHEGKHSHRSSSPAREKVLSSVPVSRFPAPDFEFSPVPVEGESFLVKANGSPDSPVFNGARDNLVSAETKILPQPCGLNQTFEKKSENSDSKDLNQTFDVKQGLYKLNETFDKTPLNRTFDVNSQSPQFNQTYEKLQENTQKPIDIEARPNTLEDVKEEEDFIEPKSCPTMIIDQTFLKSDVVELPEGKFVDGKECLNSSFISTTSSNTSLLCNGNLTVVQNPRCSDSEALDEHAEMKTIDDIEMPKVEEDVWSDTFSRPHSSNDDMENGSSSSSEKLENAFGKSGKLSCDPDLVQFIQEQFSSTDIEKICSVVEDLSIGKPIPTHNRNGNVSEVSLMNALSHADTKQIAFEPLPVKLSNPLSPKSFDFLCSIGGKPTGRDLSRESLYVKFDPLVQASCVNSLIDFTKEVEAPVSSESSPANTTVVEHLLTISPQKKADDIVPPLTPLSQRSKHSMREDKTERLRELQNEIYFLKNLYAERERTNKAKMEEFESQIAKLTGDGCVMEEKLKKSSEREKSLVRKLQEQENSIGQLKTIMEEYMKVIARLSTELENIKAENKKQVTSLNAEKESYMTHLQNTEAAFTDVHTKYEKSKKTILSLKANEALFKNTIADQIQKMEEYKEKAREAQEKAYREFHRVQEELNGIRSSHSQETTRLRAQLRKTELKLEAMQESLDQKVKENQQLTAICDELIEGKK